MKVGASLITKTKTISMRLFVMSHWVLTYLSMILHIAQELKSSLYCLSIFRQAVFGGEYRR